MPIPSTRAELIEQVTTAFEKLRTELESAGPEIALVNCVDDWSVKDVLAVRAWWTNSVVDWVERGRQEQTFPLPAEGYAWNETPRLNQSIVDACAADPYESVIGRLEEGFRRVVAVIQSLSDTELLEPGVFPWAGKWPVSRWISINTARQYTTARTYTRRAARNVDVVGEPATRRRR